MSTEIKKEFQLEIAHVLFMDIVGYSKLLINEQRGLRDTLSQIVRNTEEYRNAEIANRLIKIPTGDGMALAFFNSPEAPVECALEISRALKEHPELPLRMGVHSGPVVSGVIDVNEQAGAAGAGLNMAQRVMDCGDAGHILLSKRAAEDLEHSGHWQPHLHDLGEIEVKHGVRLRITNLYTEELGNPNVPEKLKGASLAAAASATKAPSKPAIPMWALIAMAIPIVAAIVLILVLRAGTHLQGARQNEQDRAVASTRQNAPAIPEKSIAVLPFENLSRDPDNAYFATGIQEEILTRLAKIAALKVISHTSTQQYVARPGNLPEIARQLGVAHVLEGSVQKGGNQVHINAQLIRASTDEHLWAESYDRKLENIFGVEAEVATAVAEALKAKLSGVEQGAVEQKPTSNPDAYLLYLRAREREGGVDANVEDYIAANELYAQAIALDPTFALAYARASIRNSRIFDANKDQARKSKAREQAEEALRLSPTLGEAHFALGLYLWLGERDFISALRELSIAATTSPNSAEIFWYSAAIYRTQGRWRESLATAEKAQNLDPRNAQIAFYAAYNHALVRDWPACAAGLNRLLEIAPASVFGRTNAAYLEVIRSGNQAVANAILQKIPGNMNRWVLDVSWDLSMLDRDFATAQKILDESPLEDFYGSGEKPKSFFQGCTALAHGDAGLAQSLLETARPILEAKVRDRPDDPWRRADLGLLYAYLGRKEDAIRESRRVVELVPESKEPYRRSLLESNLALVYARTGQADQAITLIQRLLSTPGAVSLGAPWSITLADLRLRWEWDPLRADRRFQKILAGPEPKTNY